MAEGRTVLDLLERAAERPDVGLRLIDRDEIAQWHSWPDVVGGALKTCGGLQALGVRAGDRVAMILPTGLKFFDAFFGTILAGAIPVPLYPPVRLGRLEGYADRTSAMLDAVSARLVLTDRWIGRLLGPSVLRARPDLGCLRLDELPVGAAEPIAAKSDDLALVQFSSGTTKEPRPVALSHGALLAQAERINGFWPVATGGIVSGVSWLPLYHDMGLIGCVLPALERPGTMTLIPPELFVARPAVWLRAISRFRATVSVAPNFAYAVCADKIRDEQIDGVDLSCWKVALCGAEPVVARVMRRFTERFADHGFSDRALTPVYGLSEAALAVTFGGLGTPFISRRFDRETLYGSNRAVESDGGLEIVSVGVPLASFSVRITNDCGQAVAAGHLGRVEVAGPSLMAGYLGQPDATRRVLRDGWLDTGDLGFFHEGELFLTGRAKDVLIIRGQNHDPLEVEEVAAAVEGVRAGRTVAVTWLPEDEDGERLVVFVEARADVARDEYPEVAMRVLAAVRAATAISPDRLEVVVPGTLPRTSSGKLRRSETLKRYLAGTLDPPKPVTPLRLLGAAARSSMAMTRLRWHERRTS